MKCINKMRLLCLCGIAAVFMSGCGQTVVSYDNPYDIYSTSADYGLASEGAGSEKTYFSQNLCVADDVNIGNDTTDSQVAEGAGTFNLATNTVTYAQNIYEKLYPASTTKILTAYIALKYGNLEDYVTVSENAANQASDSSVCGLKAGDVVQLKDLLYGMMLKSGNDAAIAIAEHIGGSVPQFVQRMNARAAELGAANTHFANPNGLPDDTHVTTAYDLALIARAAMGNDTFRKIVSTQRAEIPWAGRSYNRQLKNKNRLLESYPGATGVKTGFTSRAGRCLVFGASRDGMELVGVVLNCSDWFDEAERLMDACFETYTMARVLGPTMAAGKIAVEDGRQESARLCAMQELRVPLHEGESAQIVLDVPQSLRAPGYAGQHIGTAQVVVGGKTLASCEVVLSEYVESRRLTLDVRRVVSRWML